MAETKEWLGREVVDSRGERLGEVEDVYVKDDGDRPDWIFVKLGRLGMHSAYIPLHGAEDEEEHIKVAFAKEHIRKAPLVERKGNPPSQAEVEAVHRHYELDAPDEGWAEATSPEEEDEDDREEPDEDDREQPQGESKDDRQDENDRQEPQGEPKNDRQEPKGEPKNDRQEPKGEPKNDREGKDDNRPS